MFCGATVVLVQAQTSVRILTFLRFSFQFNLKILCSSLKKSSVLSPSESAVNLQQVSDQLDVLKSATASCQKHSCALAWTWYVFSHQRNAGSKRTKQTDRARNTTRAKFHRKRQTN